MCQIIADGLVIGFLPSFVDREGLYNGKLQEIVPKAKRPELNLYAHYPKRHFVQPKLLNCNAFMQAWFEEKSP